VNGDGVVDVITSPGQSGGPHVRVFDGAALLQGNVVELFGFLAYNPAFTGGVFVAARNPTAGPPGPPGPQGPPASSEYGYVYNTSVQLVAIEAAVLFDTNGLLTAGITHSPGASGITVASTGDYAISFSVSGVEPNQFALFVNGIVAPGTIHGSGTGTQQNNGQTILTLAAGDVLTLRNHSSAAAVTLQILAGGTQTNVNASLRIQKLN